MVLCVVRPLSRIAEHQRFKVKGCLQLQDQKCSVRRQWVRPIHAGCWENDQSITEAERRENAIRLNRKGENRGYERIKQCYNYEIEHCCLAGYAAV
jgi:hypothetical protein